MVFVYAIRGAGMYALTTTTLLRGAGIMPTWLGVVSYLLAILLLVSVTLHPAVVLLLPTWVVIVALVVFIRAGRATEPPASERQASERQTA
jgi:flagellar biosynthesis protein FliP